MDIKDDQLKVLPIEHNPETGDKLEPEERPAERRLVIGGEMAQMTDQMGRPLGAFDQSISIEMPAIDLAHGVRANCFGCKHWNQRAWHAWLSKMSQSKEGNQHLERWRHALVATSNVNPEDRASINMALLACGICEPLSEAAGAPMVTYPQAFCPTVVPETNPPVPFGDNFAPRDLDMEKFGSMAFDSVMHAALGKS